MSEFNNHQGHYGSHARFESTQSTPAHEVESNVVERSVKRSMSSSKPKLGRRSFLTGFTGAALACVLAFGVQNAYINPETAEAANGSAPISQTVIKTSDDATLAETVAAKCLPSVVAIDVYANTSSMTSANQSFGLGQGQGVQSGEGELTPYSQGSGVVLSEDGYIITNNHVVEGGAAYEVTIAGETYEAELIGTDPSSDVAVLKAKDASGLTVM